MTIVNIGCVGAGFIGIVEILTLRVPWSVGDSWEFCAKAGANISGISNKIVKDFNQIVFFF